jgi:hypothetical protein
MKNPGHFWVQINNARSSDRLNAEPINPFKPSSACRQSETLHAQSDTDMTNPSQSPINESETHHKRNCSTRRSGHRHECHFAQGFVVQCSSIQTSGLGN